MISIDPATHVITIPQADLTSLGGANYQLDTNAFRIALKDWEDSDAGIYQPQTHNHNTTVTIGGIQYARMIEILAPYTVTFQSTGTPYKVFLVNSNNNILDVTNLNDVSVASNNSGGLIGLREIGAAAETSKRLIEGLRPHHKGYGTTWYWDPSNGSDTNDGQTPFTGILTFTEVHGRVRDYGHDVILVVPKGISSTIIYEPMVITKNYVFIRGMGYNAHVHPNTTTPGGNLIEISGNGVEISGMHIEGINVLAPNCNGVVVTGSHVLLQDLTIEECTGHGITVTAGIGHDDRSHINRCNMLNNGKSGLQYNQGNHLEVMDSEFEGNVEHGIDCTGAGVTTDLLLHHCNFLRNGGYGLRIGNTNVSGTTIESECEFAFNTLGDYLDNGSNTIFQELTANIEIANSVWAKVLDTLSAEEIMRITLAALAGKRQGLGTATEQYMGQDGVTPRITLTPDVNGNGTPIVNGAP